MTQKIIFFTAGDVTTDAEKTAIAQLETVTDAYYDLQVRNSKVPNVWGSLEDADLVAGTVPADYNAKPRIDPTNLPVAGLKATQAVVNNGQVLTIAGKTYTFTVVNKVITAIVVADAA